MHTDNQNITLREQLEQYLKYWPWFVLCVMLTFGISFLYLRYAMPVYQTVASILIKDEKNSALSELAAFQDLGLTGSMNQSGFENEMLILKSKSLTERVVRELNLDVRYFVEGNIRNMELFGDVPFKVTVLTDSDSRQFPSSPFFISVISDQKFKLWDEEEGGEVEYNFGETVTLPVGNIVVTPNLDYASSSLNDSRPFTTPIKVEISSISAIRTFYRQSIQIEQLNQFSSVIQLTLNASNSKKAEAILNELIRQFNQDAMEDRNMVSRNTAEFINNRLAIITKELDSVETGKVEFKQDNKLTDIVAEGQIFLQNESEFNKRQLDVEMQLELVRTMIDYVKNGNESELLPTNLGIEKEGLASAVNSHNRLVLERDRLLVSSTPKNPIIVNLNEQISAVKSTVLGSLNNAKISLEIARNDLNAQEANVSSKISSIPTKEKIFRSITRQQNIKESLYLYLLQKREENAISLAVTTPKAKIVDYAYTSDMPVSPKRIIVFLVALIAGLAIPFAFIYARNLLDNKIRNRAYIERHVKDVSLIGEIPQLKKNDQGFVTKNDRSILAEAFRILRTNLEYLFIDNFEENDNNSGKTIFITSTVKGEGKTLVSYNLAQTLAYSGAKVVLVGGDIRNPKVHRYAAKASYKKGVVEYLIQDDVTISDFTTKSDDNENLSIMYSGTIPPNPAELWMRPRAKSLFTELKSQFDYVIVDTAPCMLVTDTFLISKYADAILYVMRAGYTEKRLLDFPLDSIKAKKLKNVAFVLNNVSNTNFGYGNKYSYTYGAQEDTFWQKVKKAF